MSSSRTAQLVSYTRGMSSLIPKKSVFKWLNPKQGVLMASIIKGQSQPVRLQIILLSKSFWFGICS